MDITSPILTYAPLITSIVIGLGIFITLIILCGKIIFRLGGLFTEVSALTQSMQSLQRDVVQGNERLRAEIQKSNSGLVDTLLSHEHTDTDGRIVFGRHING